MRIARLLLYASLTAARGPEKCPAECDCSGTRVSCTNQKLRELPSIRSDTTELDLSNNLYVELDLSHLTRLQKLTLDGNRSMYKNQGGLVLPPGLRYLSLSNCRLDKVIRISKGLSSIQTLDLSSNRIKRIEPFSFAGWNKLEDLDLARNAFSIKPNTNSNALFQEIPPTIKRLILDDNHIQVLRQGMLEPLKNLEHLSITRNSLGLIPTFTGSQANLQYLDLSENKLERILAFTFRYLQNLKHLNLAHNKLKDGKESLPVASLYIENSSLSQLNLSHNFLTRLEYSMLYQQEQLAKLDLSHNMIGEIDINGNINRHNMGQHLHYDAAWKDTRNLEFVDLSFNNLTRCESNGFQQLNKLEVLRLSNNNITVLEEKSFIGLNSIKEVDLSSNGLTDQIEDISDGLNNLKTLRKLNLASNKIHRISRSVFSNMDSLASFNIMDNPITEIEFQSFGLNHNEQWREFLIDSHAFLCDCNLSWFCKFLQKNVHLVVYNPPRCRHPPNLEQMSLLKVEMKKLKCDKNPRPIISSHPKSRSVQDGKEVKFECKAKTSEIESTKIEWQIRREGTSQWINLIEEKDLYQIHHSRPPTEGGNLVESILYLPAVANGAKGSYRCRVVNNYAIAVSTPAVLDVHKLPKFTFTPKNKTLSIGDKIKLSCEAVGYPEPTISWTHGGNNWDRYDPSSQSLGTKLSLPTNYPSSMRINKIDVEDSGKYTCIAQNSAGVASYDMYISMKPVNDHIIYQEAASSKEGQSALLDCKYPTIYPPVKVNWYFNNEHINSTSSKHFLTETGAILIITETNSDDNGRYECQVYNDIGSAVGTINLTVKDDVSTSYLDTDLPVWIWIVTVAITAILLTSLIWLIVFCRTRANGSNNGQSDLGTVETNIPSPMERHLSDNQKYHSKLLDSRFEEISSSVTATSSDKSSAKTPFYPYQNPYMSYNPFPYGPYNPYALQYSPYFNPYLHHQMPLLPAASVAGFGQPHQTPPPASSGGFGPEPTPPQTPSDCPYRAPYIPMIPTAALRARTLPDLDAQSTHARTDGTIFGNVPPMMPPPLQLMMPPNMPPPLHRPRLNPAIRRPGFGDDMDQIRSAPGPVRRRSRRSEGNNHLTRKLLFTSNQENQLLAARHAQADQKADIPQQHVKVAQIADDDGIVNRVLGPVETSD